MPVSSSSQQQPRIVSLSPAWTEWVRRLGAEHLIMARSSEGNYPSLVKCVASVTSATEGRIDGALEELLEMLLEDKPDILLSEIPLPSAGIDVLEKKLGKNVEQITLQPLTLREVLSAVLHLGRRLDYLPQAMEAVWDLELSLKTLRDRIGVSIDTQVDPPPGVVFISSVEPLETGGYWIADLIKMAGGWPLLASAGEPPRLVSIEEVKASDPDLIIFALRGRSIEEAIDSTATLQPELSTIGNDRIFVCDGKNLFHEPGPGLHRSIEILAGAISGFDVGAQDWEVRRLLPTFSEAGRDL